MANSADLYGHEKKMRKSEIKIIQISEMRFFTRCWGDSIRKTTK
jgi:hypothetical protein